MSKENWIKQFSEEKTEEEEIENALALTKIVSDTKSLKIRE